MKKTKLVLLFYGLVSLIHLLFIASGNPALSFYTKPLLMPLLIVALLLSMEKAIHSTGFILAGLVMSLAGDVLLMWDQFFIPGLICFLLTHIFYIFYFIRLANKNGWLLKKQPFLLIPVVGYTFSLLWVLLPHLDKLALPVIVYAVVISVMLASCLNLIYQVKRVVYLNFVTGAILFVLSDSLLAINKFYDAFYGAGVLIMLTYVMAQFFIVRGVLSMHRDMSIVR
jgi:uncharacterized membrane protein YhhN